jgi:hypothetical protein
MMAASITTASNVIIVGTSIIVPVDIQSSAIAYDTFNNAWIVEGTVEANIQNGTLYVDVVNTPTVLATIEGQPISVTVSNTPTVLATIEGQPISVNVANTPSVNVANTPTVLATIEGQPISVNVTNTPTVLATIEGQPISVTVSNTPTVLATIEGQPISVNVANAPTVLATIEGQPISVTVSNTPTVLATIEGQPISVNVTGGTVNTVEQPNATLLGQVVNGSITANTNIFTSNLSITQPSRILTVVTAGASGTLSLKLTVGTTTVQSYLNSGNPLNADSWYEFSIDLPSGVQINYQYTSSTTVTILVLSEPL